MRVLVTGATGFAGRWLMLDLEGAGHDPVAAPGRDRLEITDSAAVDRLVETTRPDAIAHLAAISFGPDAGRDPARAEAVNGGGTRAVLTAAARRETPPMVLVVSSSEVYGRPSPADIPIAETAPLLADQAYGRSKVSAELIAREFAAHGLPVVIVRPFNHTGPGQRDAFVVPALAERVVRARKQGSPTIVAGNIHVRRDFSDVRDVVRGYRLLLEAARGSDGTRDGPPIYNLASGAAVEIRTIIAHLAALAEVEIGVEVDPALVRVDDPVEIRGDVSKIARDVGWTTTIPLETTLRDVLAEVERRAP
jgi:GDP-4-dehydro-6-deoxy-D-mannose reductase